MKDILRELSYPFFFCFVSFNADFNCRRSAFRSETPTHAEFPEATSSKKRLHVFICTFTRGADGCRISPFRVCVHAYTPAIANRKKKPFPRNRIPVPQLSQPRDTIPILAANAPIPPATHALQEGGLHCG
jgi:hypothetical protein